MDYESLGFLDDGNGYLKENMGKVHLLELSVKAKLSSNDLDITPFLTKVNHTEANRTKANINFIVVHYTSNKNDTAKANCSYFSDTDRQASAHYFVDKSSIYQCVLDKNIAWHCGTTGTYYSLCRNGTSIGVEMCTSYKDGKYFIDDNTRDNTIKYFPSL